MMKKHKSWNIGYSFAGALLFGALATLPVGAQTAYQSIIAAQSPNDYWRFNETVASPALNIVTNWGSAGASGNGYVCTTGIPTGFGVTGSNGVVGNGVYISNPGQSAGDVYSRIDIPNIPALNTPPPFAVEFWMMPNSPFSPSDVASGPGLAPISSLSIYPGDGSRSGYTFYVEPNAVEIRIGGPASYSAIALYNLPKGQTVSTTSFSHVVGQFDGTTLSLYLNGVLVASASAVGAPPYLPNGFTPTRIGGSTFNGGEYLDANGGSVVGSGNRGWDGWLDEVAIYSNLLSPDVILSHYQAGTNNPTPAGYDALILASSPVGYWNFDQPAYTPPSPSTYTYAADSGSLGFYGTNTLGTMADQPGVPGTGDGAVFYSGVEGSLVLETNAAAANVQGQNITLAAWIKPFSFGLISDIIAQGYDESSYAENFLRVGDSFDWAYFQDDGSYGNYNTNVNPGIIYYEVGAYDGGPGYVSTVFPAPIGDLGHWVFLVGTFDGVNWNLYRNGALVSSFPGDWNGDGSPPGPALVADSHGNSHPWSVGSRSNPNPYYGMFFPGDISEATIITNAALDAVTILNLYNATTLPPVITQAPVAPSPAYLGSAASFSVWADGPGTLSYQWYSNSVLIAGETTTNLALDELTAAFDATYSVVVSNKNGTATSSAVLYVTPTLPPTTLVSESRWTGFPFSFAPVSLPNQQLSFQWDLDGSPISGATASSYSGTTTSGTVGSYTIILSNNFGSSTSSVATLTALTAPDAYVSTILADQPIAYLLLDETSGTTAYDYAGGNNGIYNSVELGLPGSSPVFTNDTAAFFDGQPLSYVGGIGPTAINFSGENAQFSIEAWANGGSSQGEVAAVVSKGHGNNGTTANEQFSISVVGGFYNFFVRDNKGNLAQAPTSFAPDGYWHYLVGVCNETAGGGNLYLFIDGVLEGKGPIAGLDAEGVNSTAEAVSIGSESSGPGPTFDYGYNGAIDQVAIYPYALTGSQIQNHFAAAFGFDLPAHILQQPISVTNYVGLPVSLDVTAAGSYPLTYQWSQAGVGALANGTQAILNLANLSYSDAGTYTVLVSNSLAHVVSVPVTVTVLAPPSTPPAIADLVLHLTFDNTLVDATGRGNNGTNLVYPTNGVVNTNSYVSGIIGQAFSYETEISPTTTNSQYATLGLRKDLLFGANVDFTVSMWIQTPLGYVGNDLPFFGDAVGSTFGGGYLFAPSFYNNGKAPNWPGSWAYSLYGSGGGIGVYGFPDLINDNSWHSLIYVFDRTNDAIVYLDGVPSVQYAQAGVSASVAGDVDNTNYATIGQDPTGAYPQSSDGQMGIDDLGVWRRALTPFEVTSIYEAGAYNGISFTGVPFTSSTSVVPGSPPQLSLTWNEGELQSTTNLSGPWADVVGATSGKTNYSIVPSTGTPAIFYRIKF